MVTYRFRDPALLVRIQPLHPVLFLVLVLCLVLPVRAEALPDKELLPDDELIELPEDEVIESRATYKAAGLNFVGSGNQFSKIGGYSTSGMTFAGNGGMVLYQAFSNLDASIAAVDAKAISSTDFDLLLNKYLGQAGTLNNIWDLINAVNNNLTAFDSRVKTALASVNSNLSSVVSAIGITNDRIGTGGYIYASPSTLAQVPNVMIALARFSKLVAEGSFIDSNVLYLGSSGFSAFTSSSRGVGVAALTAEGFLGLSTNLAGSDKSTTFSFLSPGEGGGLKSEDETVDNLLDALGLIGTHLQNPLAKLQYVLASDDDIELKDAVQDNQDSFKDNFTGSGSGAVSGSQIKDVAGISSSVGDAFKDNASAADSFAAISDSNSYSFFSQEVAEALDTTDSPEMVSLDEEDYLEGFELSEDGFYYVADQSPWDISSFLGGLK